MQISTSALHQHVIVPSTKRHPECVVDFASVVDCISAVPRECDQTPPLVSGQDPTTFDPPPGMDEPKPVVRASTEVIAKDSDGYLHKASDLSTVINPTGGEGTAIWPESIDQAAAERLPFGPTKLVSGHQKPVLPKSDSDRDTLEFSQVQAQKQTLPSDALGTQDTLQIHIVSALEIPSVSQSQTEFSDVQGQPTPALGISTSMSMEQGSAKTLQDGVGQKLALDKLLVIDRSPVSPELLSEDDPIEKSRLAALAMVHADPKNKENALIGTISDGLRDGTNDSSLRRGQISTPQNLPGYLTDQPLKAEVTVVVPGSKDAGVARYGAAMTQQSEGQVAEHQTPPDESEGPHDKVQSSMSPLVQTAGQQNRKIFEAVLRGSVPVSAQQLSAVEIQRSVTASEVSATPFNASSGDLEQGLDPTAWVVSDLQTRQKQQPVDVPRSGAETTFRVTDTSAWDARRRPSVSTGFGFMTGSSGYEAASWDVHSVPRTNEAAPAIMDKTTQDLDLSAPGSGLPSSSVPTMVSKQVSQEIVQVVKKGVDGPVELSLRPEELGNLRFEIKASDNKLHVTLFVERPEVLELFRRHGDQLLADLRLSGFGQPSLSFGDWSGRNARSAKPAGQTNVSNIEATQSEQPMFVSPSAVQVVSGRLDLRL